MGADYKAEHSNSFPPDHLITWTLISLYGKVTCTRVLLLQLMLISFH